MVEPNRNLQVKYVHTRGKLLKILKYSNQSIIEYDLIPFELTIYFPNLLQGFSGIFYNIEQKFLLLNHD